MLQLEAQKLQLEQQKNQTLAAKEQVNAAVKMRDQDLKEMKIAIDAQQKGTSEQMRAIQKDEDRSNKRAIEAMKLLGSLIKSQEANDLDESKATANLLMQLMKEDNPGV